MVTADTIVSANIEREKLIKWRGAVSQGKVWVGTVMKGNRRNLIKMCS